MGTLKAFLKDKNKEELLEDLKSLQKELDSSESGKNKITNKEKSKNKKKLFSFTKKK